MQGTYKVYIDGKVVDQGNIITNAGRIGLLNCIAGKKNGFIESIVVGIGDTAATVNDESLVFEVSGTNVNTSIVDLINEKIYFKGVLPLADQYEVREIGCFPGSILASQLRGSRQASLISNFNSQTRWNDVIGVSTISTDNNRLDDNSIKYSILASQTAKGYASADLDLSSLPPDAKFSFAYYTINIADVIIRFKTDDSNYYHFDAAPVSAGYHISSFLKSDFVSTGSPSWDDINAIEIEALATASNGSIILDGLRYDVTSGIENDLLTRAVFPDPIVKLSGITMDIEYVLDLDI